MMMIGILGLRAIRAKLYLYVVRWDLSYETMDLFYPVPVHCTHTGMIVLSLRGRNRIVGSSSE